MRRKIAMRAGAMLSLTSGLALAHHSGVMFDTTQSLTITGVVREFQWTNPHCWIQLVVEGERAREWSIEMGSPTALYRAGWRPGTLAGGQRVTLVVSPLRDGGAGALYLSGTDAEGHTLGLTVEEAL